MPLEVAFIRIALIVQPAKGSGSKVKAATKQTPECPLLF
jgi:hypothetical protein